MNIAHAAVEGGIAVHLSAPILGYFFGIPLTSTMIMVWVTMLALAVLAFTMKSRLRLIPNKIQISLEMLVGSGFDYMADALESRELARKFFPLVMTIFIFILSLNWLGLLPGVDSIGIWKTVHDAETFVPFLHPANTDLNVTISLAIIAFVAIEIAGIAFLGFVKYGGKFINFSSPLNFLIGIIELFSELARLVSFSFRLFGNIFAGKTLLLIAIFFVPFIVPVPILAFELFVGLIQAFIFAVLTLFFIKLAIAEPEH
ncbi:MAG: F0F1 ATP synthase subunit A [Candidatus Pacebacteria bacterium]|nr:F0F1 ATP synthase subunit A [Candidatus Paceibacterota bacterium]MCF7857031.1 F0F1 ATP synthase subunit A [Candidatus Paceibacterota bacterium]